MAVALEAGQTVAGLQGTYRIEAKHGQGSFGITYRARAESDGGRVIVKELRIEKLDDWKALEMFEREGRVLSSLSHPNIPAFRDFFAHGGPSPLPVGALSTYAGPEHLSLVLVQQFIEGTTLQDRIDAAQRLPPDEAETVLRALLSALHYLHDRTPPLVHRDIKPGNVILTPEGQPYLVYFGAIQDRLRSTGSVGSTIVGTLGYMPPEQTRGDARPVSDLYALGVTLIVALAGKPLSEIPFDDATGKVATARAVPRDTPKPFREALDAMTAPLLGQRAASAEDVLTHLDAPTDASDVGDSASRARPGSSTAQPSREPAPGGTRSNLTAWLGGLGGVVLIGSAYAYGRHHAAAPPTPPVTRTASPPAPYIPPSPAPPGTARPAPPGPKSFTMIAVGTSPIRGPAVAPVTIVEFSDFQCPFCRRAETTVDQLQLKYGDRVRIVWKNKPLPFHSRAEPAAQVAMEARAEKGDAAFWDVAGRLFASASLGDDDLDRTARDARLDIDKVHDAVKTHRYKAAIDADIALADGVHVNGTPHFFINGRTLVGAQSADKFAAIIDDEIAATSAMQQRGVPLAQIYETRIKEGGAGSP